jgi:hypothetical protein
MSELNTKDSDYRDMKEIMSTLLIDFKKTEVFPSQISSCISSSAKITTETQVNAVHLYAIPDKILM